MVFVALGGLLASVSAVYAVGAGGPGGAMAGLEADDQEAAIRPARAPRAVERAQPSGRSTTPADPATASTDPTVASAGTDAALTDAQPDAVPVPATGPFARVGELQLWLPADELVVLGFHESANRDALAMEPVGAITDHQNTTKFGPPPTDPAGTDYLVLSSRGRPTPATSAADLVYPDGVPLRAPVDGEVVDVREYHLYGRHLDTRIEIVPDAAPHLRIVLIHVDGAAVAAGDRVEAGRTVIAPAVRRFSFSSHIDRYTEPDRFGHVHLEVQPVDAPRPGDDGPADPDHDAASRPDEDGTTRPDDPDASPDG
ncbi:M23 family metallopeptidase [Egicoccus sp. AB-alg2]|uniref:M23 family metallopeptidase n=1 Tax=Egicoccus sp. AB-alg2 TaxID=3242693 RepID=UPI00359D43E1